MRHGHYIDSHSTGLHILHNMPYHSIGNNKIKVYHTVSVYLIPLIRLEVNPWTFPKLNILRLRVNVRIHLLANLQLRGLCKEMGTKQARDFKGVINFSRMKKTSTILRCFLAVRVLHFILGACSCRRLSHSGYLWLHSMFRSLHHSSGNILISYNHGFSCPS